MECNYHNILETLSVVVWERIGTHYDWPFFGFWLGDESYLGDLYKETFEEIIGNQITETQITLLKKKGENLEKMIHKWCHAWKMSHQELQDQQLPESCLKIKIYEYIIYQLNKQDLREIIGERC
jgi:hypothetical protein